MTFFDKITEKIKKPINFLSKAASKEVVTTIATPFHSAEVEIEELGKDIKDALKTLQDVSNRVTEITQSIPNLESELTNTVAQLPKDIINELRSTSSSAFKEIKHAQKIVDDALQTFNRYFENYAYWIQFEKWKFVEQLKQFIGNFENLVIRTSNVITHLGVPSRNDLAIVVDLIPDPFLYGLYRALDELPPGHSSDVPLWLKLSHDINETATSLFLPDHPDLETILRDPDLKTRLTEGKEIIEVLQPTLELIRSMCPEDLSINIDILGEGGGTEVSGHPVKVPFEFLAWVLTLTGIAFDKCLAVIADQADQQAAEEDAAWRKEIKETLEHIAKERSTQEDTAAAIDDLTRIEGIGPKVAELLTRANISTFARLAETAPNKLRDILQAGGSAYNHSDPSTWPSQAALARAGAWDSLGALQDELRGGKKG